MTLRTSSLLTLAVLAFGLLSAAAHAAEVAFLYSTYQEEQFAYMPGEYQGKYAGAGAKIKAAGFPWDRVESKAVESGALIEKGYKVLVISYIGTMSAAEAAAITEFVKQGGKIFAVYASCRSEYKDGEFVKADNCLIADALGMDSGGKTASGCGYMKADMPDHPLMRLLPIYVMNPHGYSVRMKPREGTKVVASWVGSDLTTPVFRGQDNGAILVSESAVYFAGFLWRFPEAKIIVRNALSFLLGREQEADKVVWERVREASPVKGGLNLQYAKTETEDVDALGWQIAEPKHGILRPTCAVVYPAESIESYYVAKRLARALSCPLVPDRAAVRHGLGAKYDLILVGRLASNRCENFIGNMQRGIAQVLADAASTEGKAVVRVAPEGAWTEPGRVLLVGGSDLAGLRRAEETTRRGTSPRPTQHEGKVLIWQPPSAFDDLVYPWTKAGAPISELRLPAAVNQRAKAQFVITASMGYGTLDLDMELSPLVGPAGTIGPDRMQLLATRYIKSSITKIPEPDPLVPATNVAVDPGNHQQMWLIVDCTDTKPGEYAGSLSILKGGEKVAELGISLEVASIVLAPKNRHGLLTTVWDYRVSGCMHGALLNSNPSRKTEDIARATYARWNEHYEKHFRQHWRAYIRDLEDHGVNVMFLATGMCIPHYQMDGKQIDESNLERLVRYGKQHGFKQFILTQILGQGCSYPDSDKITEDGSPIFSPTWDEAYKRLLRAYVEFFERMGLDFKEWAIYPYDEPHTDHARKVVKHVAKLIDEVEPRIQLWSDPARPRKDGEDVVDYWQSMEDCIDIWWPGDGYIRKGSEALEYLRGLDEPFGFYRCGAYSTKDRSKVHPGRYYRAFGWQVMDREADGMGFWTWCAWIGDSWNDEDSHNRPGDGGVIYEGPEGPITSISWEAWSEGIDDYKYLAALKAAIEKREAAAGKDDARCAEAGKLLADAIARVVKSPREADPQRARVRQAILDLTQ